MPHQTYVFTAELVGFEGVRRTVAVRNDLKVVDLHYALQSAFGWDDDHLYSFWLDGSFWGAESAHYMHPEHARSLDPPGQSACARLEELDLAEGRQVAYIFDLEREWRVALTVREVHAVLSQQKDTAYTTVLKMLTIMADKGLVLRDDAQRTHTYRAVHADA